MAKKNQASAKDEVVVVVRPDGKEFLIKRDLLAEHINRGFDVKHKADMPSEEELSKAVGYKGAKGEAPEQPEGGDEATIPEEKPVAKKSVKK